MRYIFYLLLLTTLTNAGLYSQSSSFYDGNQVNTMISCSNSMFWDMISNPTYEFPAGSDRHTMFTANLWATATDSNGTLRGIGDRYLAGRDTWPGPLEPGTATTTNAVSNSFDQVWKITEAEITDYINAYNSGAIGVSYTIPPNILTWPGNGPAGYASQLFPYHDENSDGVYDPNTGDYPIIKGSQMLSWILNDNLAAHTETNGPALGIEIHFHFYGCTNPDVDNPVNRTTFLEIKIINRSDRKYNDLHIGFNTDGDIGGPIDDYLQTHVSTNTVQYFNADGYDDNFSTSLGYYGNPPVQSVTMLKTTPPVQPLLGGMMFYNNGPGPTGDPSVLPHIKNYLNSVWKDGSHLVYGGAGHMVPGAIDCRYMFPASSDPTDVGTYGVPTVFDWSEIYDGVDSIPNTPGDRRALLSSGPFQLLSGGSLTFTYALVTTQDSTLSTDSLLAKNIDEVTYLTQQFNNNALPCVFMGTGLDDKLDKLSATLYPNPASDMVQVKSTDPVTVIEILTYHGSVIRSVSTGNTSSAFSVSDLANGIYLVKTYFANNRQTSVQKLVVMH